MAITTEERTAKLEGVLEQMDKRLTNIEREVHRINARIDQLTNQVNTRFDQVNTRIDQKFNWLMGMMITMWVSLIFTMLFK